MLEIFQFVNLIAGLPLISQLICVFGIASCYKLLRDVIQDVKHSGENDD